MNRKSLAAGIGAAGLLGLGLYLAVPAAADDSSPSPQPTASHQKGDDRRHGKQRPWRHRAHWAARGVHGESTVRRKDGAFHLHTWQRGQIAGVSGTAVTVRSPDGVAWTWTTNGDTRVRKDGAKSAASALASGDRIVVMGERTGATRTARLMVVPKKR